MLYLEVIMRGSVILFFACSLAFVRQSPGQDVVSASAGVLQYFEGAVVVDDKAVEHKSGSFVSLKNGSSLRTVKGRAELLLTPGVYLRMDENSGLRMESNSLTDTRFQLTGGAAIVDSLNARPGNTVTLVLDGSEVRFPSPGVYRIDCDLAELQVYSGEAKVTHHGTSTPVDSSQLYYFRLELTIKKFGEGATDEFYDWAHNRSDEIADHNQMALAEQADAEDADAAAGVFAVPPLSSLPGYASPSTVYSTYASPVVPFYAYPQAQPFGYPFFTSFLLLPPLTHKPVTSNWPITTGAVYRPRPIVTRWPTSSISGFSNGVSHYPATIVHHPVGTTFTHPVVVTPRVTSPAPVMHAPAPHVMAVGHR
jgi:hypothetical protein